MARVPLLVTLVVALLTGMSGCNTQPKAKKSPTPTVQQPEPTVQQTVPVDQQTVPVEQQAVPVEQQAVPVAQPVVPAAEPAERPAPAAPVAQDATDRVILLIEELEAVRSLGDGKLVRYLADPEPRIRARAALALGRIGDPRPMYELISRFRDDVPMVRAAALLAVAIQRDDRLLEEVTSCVNDDDALVRQRAVEALGFIGSPRSFDTIVGALKDPDLGVASAAADACFRLRDPRAVQPLIQALMTGLPLLRFHVTYALGRLQMTPIDPLTGRPGPLEPEIDAALRTAHPALLAAVGDENAQVVTAALIALSRRNAVLEHTEPIQAALSSNHPEVVAAALAAICPQRNEEAVQAHVARLGHQNPFVRWAAVRGLAYLHETIKGAAEGQMSDGVEQAIRQVVKAEPEMVVRAAAIEALALIKGASVLEELQDTFVRHDDYRLRTGLVRAAAQVGGTRALVILRGLVADRDARVRVEAVRGLGQIGGEIANQLVVRALEDRSASVRAQAAEVLRDLGDVAAVGPLIRAYRESQNEPSLITGETRYRILQAIARLGGRRQIEVLGDALTDPSPMVRNNVLEMMEAINGYPTEVKVKVPPDFRTRPVARDFKRGTQPRVILFTNKGEIHLELYPDVAPAHVATFLALIQNGYYTGKTFHRVVPNHVVQAGDADGTGYGSLDFTIPDEPSGEPFLEGALGLAQLGRDTGSAQFFITLSNRPHLNMNYTLFGRVQQGMGVVKTLLPGDRITKAVWDR